METSLDPSPITQVQAERREVNSSGRLGFAQRKLPWLIGAAFLIVYSVTLARWVTYQGMPSLARAAGWDWTLAYHAPLEFLVTYPIRWLPAAWQVIGLNVLSMVCSVLTLVLLARAVSILPHDRTRDQRQLGRGEFSLLSMPGALLPPILAALICGLQLTFWEHAVVFTSESLDLLLFAYCVRCLLEFRLDGRNTWLYRTAFVFGLGMTTNFAMIGFLPVYLVALLWMKKKSFFNVRFLGTMAGLGAVGLLLYLLLPAINSGSPLTEQSFWEILKVNLGFQKSQLLGFPRYIVLLVALTSIVPVLYMAIKWGNNVGDTSAVGNALVGPMFHVKHLVFLVACVYVAFDPPFSPRKLAFGKAMLPFYFLGALSVGYFAGYFLLVFGKREFKTWVRYRELRKGVNVAIISLVCVGAVAASVALAIRNYPEVRKSTGRQIAQVAEASVATLPEQGGVILSDDEFRLYAVYEALARKGLTDRYILLHTAVLQRADYQRYLHGKYGQRWPGELARRPMKRLIDQYSVAHALVKVSETNRMFYLQPSFGYFFEHFYLEPRKLVYEMKRYPKGSVAAPPMSPEVLKENDAFWRQFIARDLAALRQPLTVEKTKKGGKSTVEVNSVTSATARFYARALTYLGVELQKAGDLETARDYLAAAVDLYPDSASAFMSLDFNGLLREGKTESAKPSEGAIKRLQPFGGNWQQVMGVYGPIDDPSVNYVIAAQMFARGGNFRQASQLLMRIQQLNPKALPPRIALAGMLVQAQFPDQALELITQIRNEPKEAPVTTEQQMALIQSEAWAHIFKDDLAGAENVLQAAESKYPGDDTPFSTLIEIYFRLGMTDKVGALLERELKRKPDDVGVLINYSAVKMQNNDYAAAIAMLDRALKTQPDNAYALMNRAIANLKSGRLDEARADYESIMSRQSRVPHSIHYGLAEIAWRKKQRKTALKHYTDYMKSAPAGTAEYDEVQKRIKALKAGSFSA